MGQIFKNYTFTDTPEIKALKEILADQQKRLKVQDEIIDIEDQLKTRDVRPPEAKSRITESEELIKDKQRLKDLE